MTQPRSAASSPVAIEPVPTVLSREQSLFTRRRYDQALDVLTALLARPDVRPRQRFEALCRKAECLENLKQPGQAVELLREIVRAFPREALGHSLLGEYLHRINDDARGALAALGRALRLSPKDPDTWWWKGQVYQHGLSEFRRARGCYKAALEADPKYASAMDALAALCEGEGRWIEAIDWRKAHYRRTRTVTDLAALADLYLRIGNVHAAMKYARNATSKEGGTAAAWLSYAKAYAAGHRPARAIRALRKFAQRANPDTGPFVYSRDFAFLEPLAERDDFRRLLPRIPTQ